MQEIAQISISFDVRVKRSLSAQGEKGGPSRTETSEIERAVEKRRDGGAKREYSRERRERSEKSGERRGDGALTGGKGEKKSKNGVKTSRKNKRNLI